VFQVFGMEGRFPDFARCSPGFRITACR